MEARQIPTEHVQAFTTIAESVRRFLDHEFSLDMPDELVVSPDLERANRLAIWNDGANHVYLTLRRQAQLEQPSRGHVFCIYGLSYEIAELALKRNLGEASWFNEIAVKGWCHYAAGAAVDRLWAEHGPRLWPDAYDYSAEGSKRLEAALKKRKKPPVIESAGQWRELVRMVGGRNIGALFRAWREVDAAATDPGAALQATLLELSDRGLKSRVARWFSAFKKLGLQPSGGNDRHRPILRTKHLRKRPLLLKHDDDGSEGRKRLDRDGHVVFFETPPDRWYVTKIHVYAERYGLPLRKMEDITITLCRESMEPIVSWQKPYGLFRGSRPRWFHIPVSPAPVSGRFALCLRFFCADQKGVRVHVDDSTSGHSAIGVPGRPAHPLNEGDWMIRVELDTAEWDNPLIWWP